MSAWVPWVLLTAFVFVWGLPQMKAVLGAPTEPQRKEFEAQPDRVRARPAAITIKVSGLHNEVARDKPIVSERTTERALYEFNWLSATGTSIFLAAVLSAVWLRVGPRRFVYLFGLTCYRMRWPLFTIACMLAIAFTTRYSGMDATLGMAFTKTGVIYPLFAALLGWLGVALTGSDTSANALFGSLQTITAERLVNDGLLPLDPMQAKILLATANSTGGVMGKMIDAQSVLMGLLVLFQAYVWQSAIPT
jgi:lactate permease